MTFQAMQSGRDVIFSPEEMSALRKDFPIFLTSKGNAKFSLTVM